jgi:hypothetical protein
MRLGAGAAGATEAAGALGAATGLGAAAGALTAAGGAATADARGGVLRASASACLRARIAFIASPGFEMCDRSKAGLASTLGLALLLPPRRSLK